MIIPVILSGGKGSRLWPLSRELYPKQFLPLVNDHTMLQNTVLRLQDISELATPVVLCNEEHRFMVAEQLRSLGINPDAVLLEPVGRGTAPAVAVAAFHALNKGEDVTLLVLPADQVIGDVMTFQKAVESMIAYASAGHLITFGIVPEAPETGYGYIKAGKPLDDQGVFQVERFVEKPDLSTAQSYLETGGYYWNSGMFMFQASVFLQELERWVPEIHRVCREAYQKAEADLDFLRLDKAIFQTCPSDSIDYAVMEKTTNAVVMPLSIGWNDVGSWSSLWEVGNRDADGNVAHGDTIAVDTEGSYLHSDYRLVAALGVQDLVIVETSDAILVAHKDRVQDVKKIVTRLHQEQRDETLTHRKVYRPWGAYDSIDQDQRFQVKRMTIKPGARLSLQMHHHRSEHWIVVHGTARITKGDESFLLGENQSTYIPMGTPHRLENPGKIPLELIEVQSGSYLGEDDIVRFDDVYGRQG